MCLIASSFAGAVNPQLLEHGAALVRKERVRLGVDEAPAADEPRRKAANARRRGVRPGAQTSSVLATQSEQDVPVGLSTSCDDMAAAPVTVGRPACNEADVLVESVRTEVVSCDFRGSGCTIYQCSVRTCVRACATGCALVCASSGKRSTCNRRPCNAAGASGLT